MKKRIFSTKRGEGKRRNLTGEDVLDMAPKCCFKKKITESEFIFAPQEQGF